MAAPVVEYLTARTTTDNSTTIALTIPAAAVAGEVIFAQVISSSSTRVMSTVPAGWTVATDDPAVLDYSTWDYWCEVGAGGNNNASDTPTWTLDAASNVTVRGVGISGADTSGPNDFTYTLMPSASSVTVQGPTTTVADCLIISFTSCDPASFVTWNDTNGETEQWDAFSIGADLLASACYTVVQATAAYVPNTFTPSQNQEMVGSRTAFAPAATSTTDLEGYRWRNDDGTETTATWAAAQDVGVTAATGDIRRLRVIVNTTGDLPATAFKLQFRKQGVGDWEDLA